MPSKASHTHFSRAILSIAHFFKLQGAYTDWRIDGRKFLEAFEHQGEDGQWVSQEDWKLGPCSGNDEDRKAAFERWAENVRRSEMFIPSIASKGGRVAVNSILSGEKEVSDDKSPKETRKQRAPSKCKFCGSINWITKKCGKLRYYSCQFYLTLSLNSSGRCRRVQFTSISTSADSRWTRGPSTKAYSQDVYAIVH